MQAIIGIVNLEWPVSALGMACRYPCCVYNEKCKMTSVIITAKVISEAGSGFSAAEWRRMTTYAPIRSITIKDEKLWLISLLLISMLANTWGLGIINLRVLPLKSKPEIPKIVCSG